MNIEKSDNRWVAKCLGKNAFNSYFSCTEMFVSYLMQAPFKICVFLFILILPFLGYFSPLD